MELRNKFLMATPSNITRDVDNNLPDGLEYISLPGHFFQMIGIKSDNEIYFIADCLFRENIINKYHLSFIYDVKEYLNTLDKVKKINSKLFIPSHADPCEDITYLADININKIKEIGYKICEFCKDCLFFEELLQRVFSFYNLKMDFNQYVLIGITVRSFLSYLHDDKKIQIQFVNNKLIWKTIE